MPEEQSAEIIGDRPCSCELSVNAKGDVSFKVKAYDSSLLDAIRNAFRGKDLVHKMLAEKANSPKGEPA